MDRLLQDVGLALRGFRRTPTFTGTVLVILALGIGMTSAMVAITGAVLRKPLPVSAPHGGVTIWPTITGAELSLLPADLQEREPSSRTMRAIAGFVHWGAFPMAI